LSAIENGRADLSIKTFDRLCKALSVSANRLYLEAELLEKHYLNSDLAQSDDRGLDDRGSANPLKAQCWLNEYLQHESISYDDLKCAANSKYPLNSAGPGAPGSRQPVVWHAIIVQTTRERDDRFYR